MYYQISSTGPDLLGETLTLSVCLLSDFFNWTWSGRRDSDIYRPEIQFELRGKDFEFYDKGTREWPVKSSLINDADLLKMYRAFEVRLPPVSNTIIMSEPEFQKLA